MFRDLRRVNRWLGGTWLTARGLQRSVSYFGAHEPITILDVASGSMDIPHAMLKWAHRKGRKISVAVTDINPDVLSLATDAVPSDSVQIVAADALCLPFATDGFDLVASSFFLHHLDPDDVVTALSEMRRVGKHGVLINDLIRGWPSFLGAWTLSRILTRNRISRHDAPLSARRAYSLEELRSLAARAGLEPVARYGFFGYRVMLVTTAQRATPDVVPASGSMSAASTT